MRWPIERAAIRRGRRRVGLTLKRTVRDFDRHNYLTYAAALAFFFLLSFFPLLIFLASAMAFTPVPHLFDQILQLMARVVPAEAMGLVRGVVSDVLRTNTGLLSIGILGALWAASGGFNAMIGALNVAYDVKEGRPFWKRRLVAIGMTVLIGSMTTVALVALVLGPQFGAWAAQRAGLGPVFAAVWPWVRWSAVLLFTIFSIEVLYFIGPNVKQRFWSQIPGAMVAVALWLGASWGLSYYMRSFANFNKTYGALGAGVALMLWLYVSAIAVLFGAELNAEWLGSRGEHLPEREEAPPEAEDEELDVA